jgi:DNA-binding transcriptional ArsR family regulator
MNINPNLSNVASIVSEPSRAAILTVLLDNRFHSAGELAYMARIKPQTTSFHLSKMIEANLITVEKQGRHRYFRIQGPEVAKIMETLLPLSPPAQIRSFNQSTEDKAIRQARTCYDHIAGFLGVQLTDSFIKKGFLTDNNDEFLLSEGGVSFLASLGIDVQEVRKKRRSFSHKCLDWSERRHHLAGALGNVILELFIELNWVKRLPKTRALEITSIGKKAFLDYFSIDVSEFQK